jgi:prepilin-type N-terminal cleavage/methylation domain-containing protein
MQLACQLRQGFTLLELLVVIVILAILASCLAISVGKARALARQADCKSNMRNLGAAILVYRSEHGGRNPPWLSSLYPTYVDDKHLFVCRSDASKGTGRNRPAGVTSEDTAATQKFPETIDNVSNSARTSSNACSVAANTDIKACSYFYEFSAAFYTETWPYDDLDGNSEKSWWEHKEWALAHGPYSSSRMPIVRCYHHAFEGRIRGYANADALKTRGSAAPNITNEKITINVAYAGNVYVGPLWWEGALQPGEPGEAP